MIDPREHLECIARLSGEITAAIDRGDCPSLADAKLVVRNAQVLEMWVRARFVETLPAKRDAEADKASQFATLKGERL